MSSVHERSWTGDDLFKRAKSAADIEAVAGVQLYPSGAVARGQCPLCGAGKGKRSGGPFACHTREKWFRCWTCGEHGDVIELERLMYGLPDETAADAARRILGEDKPDPRRKPRAAKPIPVYVPDDSQDGWTLDFARRIAKESAPASGTLVERYLRWRGFSGWVLEEALKRLRYHPMTFHSRDDRGQERAYPTMVLRVHAPAGATGGIHTTYILGDGCGRPDIEGRSSKIMYGPQGRDGRAGGGWLTHPYGPGPLIVGEGIETVMSVAMLLGRPCRMFATLALDRLQGGWLSRGGCVDIDAPRSDPGRPALTWPEPLGDLIDGATGEILAPAAPWGEVIIAVDHDMKPIRKKTLGPMGKTVDRIIGPDIRARVCGTLAQAAWEATTDARVRVHFPPIGKDFNDVWKERLACQT